MDDGTRLCIFFHRPNVASAPNAFGVICDQRREIALWKNLRHQEADRMASAATRVFMVRHGATVVSAEDRFAGATDVALSDEGREQTRRLAERLSHEKIAAVYASPLGRTVETAQILASPHMLEVQTRDGFREISHGHWEGMKRREVEEKFPNAIDEWEK